MMEARQRGTSSTVVTVTATSEERREERGEEEEEVEERRQEERRDTLRNQVFDNAISLSAPLGRRKRIATLRLQLQERQQQRRRREKPASAVAKEDDGDGRKRSRPRSSSPSSESFPAVAPPLTERLRASSQRQGGREGRGRGGWTPPALQPLPRGGAGFTSAWTYLGPIDRFELVKSANRSTGETGQRLEDSELEFVVLAVEEAEEAMARADFSTAATLLEQAVQSCPNFTLAIYKLALTLLAARGLHAAREASELLRWCMALESDNAHMRTAVDRVLLVMSSQPVPDLYWEEAQPMSKGDLIALHQLLDNEQGT